MKNRERQRANRRKYKTSESAEKPWKNSEGYTDLTAYKGVSLAMGKKPKNVEYRKDIIFLQS